MSVNKYLPHVFVFPEDDANRQLVNGFLLYQPLLIRQIYVLPVAGGWTQVLERFQSLHIAEMDRHPPRSTVLLIDFDGRQERLTKAKATVPPRLNDRVFILGVLSKPEALRQAGLGSYEGIGLRMAQDCHNETAGIWRHELLQHNAGELDRLRIRVGPHLLSPS